MGADLVLFEHQKTGGRLLWIANEDTSELMAKIKSVTVESLPEEIKTYTVNGFTDESGIRHIEVPTAWTLPHRSPTAFPIKSLFPSVPRWACPCRRTPPTRPPISR